MIHAISIGVSPAFRSAPSQASRFTRRRCQAHHFRLATRARVGVGRQGQRRRGGGQSGDGRAEGASRSWTRGAHISPRAPRFPLLISDSGHPASTLDPGRPPRRCAREAFFLHRPPPLATPPARPASSRTPVGAVHETVHEGGAVSNCESRVFLPASPPLASSTRPLQAMALVLASVPRASFAPLSLLGRGVCVHTAHLLPTSLPTIVARPIPLPTSRSPSSSSPSWNGR